jgi:hypothetical protein
MSEKPGGNAPAPLAIREIHERVAALKSQAQQRHLEERQKHFKSLQLKLFPDWPDDRRATPNTIVRSAVFGVVRRGKRQRIEDMPVAGPPGWNITLSGWRLDQHDCDIWLEVMHLARLGTPGEEVRFTLSSMLRRIGRHSKMSKGDYTWLEQRLKHLAGTIVGFESERYMGVMGALIHSFWVDRKTGEGVVRTNPEIRPLFESITHLDCRRRPPVQASERTALNLLLQRARLCFEIEGIV